MPQRVHRHTLRQEVADEPPDPSCREVPVDGAREREAAAGAREHLAREVVGQRHDAPAPALAVHDERVAHEVLDDVVRVHRGDLAPAQPEVRREAHHEARALVGRHDRAPVGRLWRRARRRCLEAGGGQVTRGVARRAPGPRRPGEPGAQRRPVAAPRRARPVVRREPRLEVFGRHSLERHAHLAGRAAHLVEPQLDRLRAQVSRAHRGGPRAEVGRPVHASERADDRALGAGTLDLAPASSPTRGVQAHAARRRTASAVTVASPAESPNQRVRGSSP